MRAPVADSLARNARLAPTPPATTSRLSPQCSTAATDFATRTSTIAAWNSGVVTGRTIARVAPILGLPPQFEPPVKPFPLMVKLGAYHAVVEFADQAALDGAMALQAKRGIHTGGHGHILKFVHDLHVEIFTSVTAFQPDGLMACEI